MQYIFHNLDGLVEHFAKVAESKRDVQKRLSGAKAREAGIEASDFEYVASVLRQSDLIHGTMIFTSEDLHAAQEQVESVIKNVSEMIESLQDVQSMLSQKHERLGLDWAVQVANESKARNAENDVYVS